MDEAPADFSFEYILNADFTSNTTLFRIVLQHTYKPYRAEQFFQFNFYDFVGAVFEALGACSFGVELGIKKNPMRLPLITKER